MENLSLIELERLMQKTREKSKQIEQTWEKQKTERIKELRAKKVEIEKELMILETSGNVENIDPSHITAKRSRIATSTPNIKSSTSAECSGIAANIKNQTVDIGRTHRESNTTSKK